MKDEKRTFEYYFTTYYQQAYGYICKRITDRFVAEDLTMDAFLACFQRFDDFDPNKATFQTWLYVVINNKLKNYYRDQKQLEQIDEGIEEPNSFEDDIIEAEELSRMRELVAEALETLSDSQKSIVILKYFKNMQAKDIGVKMGMSPGNVRVQLT